MRKILVSVFLFGIATAIAAQTQPSADKIRQDKILDIVRPGQKTVVGYMDTDLRISMQERVPPGQGSDSDACMVINRIETWKPSETALIICDMRDKHCCDSSNARFGKLAVALNRVVEEARRKGVKIVHAPSGCMDYYKNCPQRRKAKKYRNVKLSALANGDRLPSEENAVCPVAQPDKGCESKECKLHKTWTKQTEALSIEKDDLISDSGAELGAYFKKKGIKNVILTGVDTDMSIMTHSFGLRAMKRMGMNVVLMRDMTGMMHNPEKAHSVDHCSGSGPMLEYIETYVCPSIVSADFTGAKSINN
ncbi:MAG: isochorismatase family protein [Prevotellaceae bacterium]|nr:isochorismatase family protein [Prevotellaceae bacterium]